VVHMSRGIEILYNQFMEESRYYRRFHHTLFMLFTTIYLSLTGALTTADLSCNMILHLKSWTVFGLLIFAIPAFYIWLILKYHFVYAKMKTGASHLASLLEVGGYADPNLENIIKPLTSTKYTNIESDADERGIGDMVSLKSKWKLTFLGTGHIAFIAIFILAVLLLAITICNL
jgi:ABC-type sugar transport system permease subunit